MTSKSCKRNRQNAGFTMIEVVVSLVILVIIAIGFSMLLTGNLSIAKKGYDHNDAGIALGNAIETGVLPEGMTEQTVGTPVTINLSNNNVGALPGTTPQSTTLTQGAQYVEFSFPADDSLGSLYYFRLPQPEATP